MTFEQAIDLIEVQKILYVKVVDFNKNRILALEAATPGELQEQLRQYKDAIMHYGKVTFICADEKSHRANWRDALQWQVTFIGTVPTQNNLGIGAMHTMPGMMTPEVYMLKTQLIELQQRVEWEKKFDELKRSLEGKGNNKKGQFDDIQKLIPLLPLFMQIDPAKMEQITALGALSGVMNNPTPPVQQTAGMGSLKDNPQLETTPEEEKMLDDIEQGLVDLTGKVELTSIKNFIDTLNADPTLIKKLEALIATFSPQT